MRQFDLYINPNVTMRAAAPYVVVMSSHFLDDVTETIVAPVFARRKTAMSGVEIRVNVDGADLLIVLTGLAAVRTGSLKQRQGSLLAHEDDIRRAIDRLFTGF